MKKYTVYATQNIMCSYEVDDETVKEDFLNFILNYSSPSYFEDFGGDPSKLKVDSVEVFSEDEDEITFKVKCNYDGVITYQPEVYFNEDDEWIPEEDNWDRSDENAEIAHSILDGESWL